jgi:hypothetical protein
MRYVEIWSEIIWHNLLLKTQKMIGGAKHRQSSFGFYALNKTYIAIESKISDILNV